jgi:tetratricopeptide (TPR) repeat protein
MVRRLAAFVLVVTLGCVPTGEARTPTHLDRARAAAVDGDAEAVAAWLMAELVAPGGKRTEAEKARKRLDELGGGGMVAELARGVDDDAHGRFGGAARAYLAALTAARKSESPDAAVVGWFVAHRLGSLAHTVTGSWEKARGEVEAAIEAPGALGWRARGELVEWWSREAVKAAASEGFVAVDALLERIAERHGCLGEAMIAGPFGHGVLADHRVHFEAEQPAPWPPRFRPDAMRGTAAEVFEVERLGCRLRPRRGVPNGVYYVQTFVDLPAERDLVLAVQGAHAIFVDDHLVLERDVSTWGVWPRFGVRLRLGAGRHRILARLLGSETSIRMLGPTGVALGLKGSSDESAPYSMVPPQILADPNVLEPWLRALGVAPLAGTPPPNGTYDLDDPALRYLASYLAHVEGQDDVAGVVIEPLLEKQKLATPLALAQQAVSVDGDAIYPQGVARDLGRQLRHKAAELDPNLWGPQLWLALDGAEKDDPGAVARRLEALAERFPEVPAVIEQLGSIYGQLGWKGERQRLLERAAERFPEDTSLLEALADLYDEHGEPAKADALRKRMLEIDPANEVALRRALVKNDWAAARKELERLAKMRQDPDDAAVRLAALDQRAGVATESLAGLELGVEQNPADVGARLALADARFAAGDRQALTLAMVDAIRAGADEKSLRSAIELVEGATSLEPFRRDGLAVIAEVQKKGVELPGTAARVLDYGAVWIEADGSARMLEHEILKIQSREGIAQHAEQQLPRGTILRMRTIKSDGRILEPELVSGKPTVTMPHLEVGDYVETESIWPLSDGGSLRFRSPRWFFREENTSYHQSEFVVVAPEGRSMTIETTGEVPEPTIEKRAGLTVRRWRVEGSVAVPEEPLSAPIQEFMPSVRVGWGMDLESHLAAMSDVYGERAARDPRMVRIARTIASGKPGGADEALKMPADERVRHIYRWVLDNVEDGEERSGPRIVTGQSGDRMQAFLYLCELAGVRADLGLVRDRLAPPPSGPLGAVDTFTVPAVRVATEKGVRWLLVHDRFAPYGYLPSSVRGQPAVLLTRDEPRVTEDPPPLRHERTESGGAETGIVHKGDVELRADGSAVMTLTQEYHGNYAIQLRTKLDELPPARHEEWVEAQLVGAALPGGRLQKLRLPNLTALDEPVRMELTVEVPNLARVAQGELVLDTPFLGRIARLAQLPQRETPLYIPERIATRTRVDLRIKLPPGATIVGDLDPAKVEDERLRYEVADKKDGAVVVLARMLEIPAGRVQPSEYPAFRELVLRADEVLNRSLRLRIE